LHLPLHVATEIAPSQRTQLDTLLHGIAHRQRLGLFDERLGKGFQQWCGNQEALGVDAALAAALST
jgi:hypothetical protein